MAKQTIKGENGKEYELKEKKPFYKKTWFKILIGILVIILIIQALGGNDNTSQKENNDISGTNNVITTESNESEMEDTEVEAIDITATELITAYENNEVKADKDYKGKLANISGVVRNIGIVLDNTYVTIDGGEDMEFISVQCNFEDEDEIEKVSNLSKGDNIVIQGVIDGQSLDISVKDSKIIE